MSTVTFQPTSKYLGTDTDVHDCQDYGVVGGMFHPEIPVLILMDQN